MLSFKNNCSAYVFIDYFFVLARSQNCEKRQLVSSCLRASVRLSVHLNRLGSHWTDFNEI